MMKKNNILDAIETLRFIISRNLAALRRTDGKFIRRQEKRLESRLNTLWRKQQKWIIEESKALSFFQENSLKIRTNAVEDEIDEFLRKLPEQETIAKTIVAAMNTALFRGYKNTHKKFNLGDFGIAFNLQNPDAIKYLGRKLSHELSQSSGTIHATTTRRISKILKDAAESGQSYFKTSQQIQSLSKKGVFSQARGELIATREIGIAYEEGNAIPLREFKIKNPNRHVLKFWRTVGDDKVTPKHRDNQKQSPIELSERFVATGDQNAPGSDNPRCRCATEYQITSP